MRRYHIVVIILAVLVLVGGTSAYAIWYFGLGPADFYLDNPANDKHRPDVTVRASYNSSEEAVRVYIERGELTASRYDYVEVRSDPGGPLDETSLKSQGKRVETGLWVDSDRQSLRDFPLSVGDSVVVLTTDRIDDDGDGISGVDGVQGADAGDTVAVFVGSRGVDKIRIKIGLWKIEGNTLIRTPVESAS